MSSPKQQNYLKYLIIQSADDIPEINEWYLRQPDHNTMHSDQRAHYREQILLEKIQVADYYLVKGLIDDLEKMVYANGEVLLDSVLERLNNL
jgi:hypothetical protein